jgi:histidinol-phosphate aminotransferase
MPDLTSLARPEVRALKAYHLDQVPCRFKLDQNEVPWDLPRRLKQEVGRRLAERDWARYPDFHGDELRRALGELHGHPWRGVLVGNGSNELLEVAVAAFTPVGGEVLIAEPTFTLYRMFALRAGSGVRALPPRPDLELPLAEIEAAVEENPRRPVVLCSPNNPTGAAAPPEWVEGLLARLQAPLLLDNAYGEFCRHDYRPLLERHPHLLVFRTFSKAWSLGGMRLGYVLAHPDLTTELIKIKLPYNLSHAGLVIGQVVLEARAAMRRRVAAIVALRRRWSESLTGFGFEVLPSEGNFLLARVPEERLGLGVDRVRRGLGERGILVRDVSAYPGLAGCMRVSVGGKRALRATEAALEEMLERGGNEP